MTTAPQEDTLAIVSGQTHIPSPDDLPAIFAGNKPHGGTHSSDASKSIKKANETTSTDPKNNTLYQHPPQPLPNPSPQHTEQPLPPLPSGALGIIDELLHDRQTLVRRLDHTQGLVHIARAMLLTVIVCAVAFGASMGFYRGGIQILYAAIKMPLAILLTAAICAPVYSALKLALEQRTSLVADFALILSSLALACLVIMSLAPLLLMAALQTIDYHRFIMLAVGLCALGGTMGYTLFFRGMHRQVSCEINRRIIAITVLLVLGLVSSQMLWITRPFVVRPKTVETPFLRPLEGSFMDAVQRSFDSARGVYQSERTTHAPHHRRAVVQTPREARR
ncbi:MAG: hypothetical protein AAFS10_20970 [Myxococcota bacterium]